MFTDKSVLIVLEEKLVRQMARALFLGLFFIALVVSAKDVRAQESFYKGKVIRIVEAYDAGGGYDTYARVIARHLGKHIPGNPTVAVENMTGARRADRSQLPIQPS